MGQRNAPLSQRQVDVLRWVADGCPDGVWKGFSYKHTAHALADRGLIRVERRRNSWRAVVTDDGRYYLEHGTYMSIGSPRQPTTASRRQPNVSAATSSVETPPVTPHSLLAELEVKAGVLTVANPRREVRAAYRSAISRVITDGLLPEGHRLRHTGRDRGDLVIRLVRMDEEPGRSEPLPAIPVPTGLRNCHETVAALRDSRRLLLVSDEARERALRIAQAVAGECARRGYRLSLRAGDVPSFQVSIGQDDFGFTLSEESEKREVADPEKLTAAKYAWQRVPSVIREVPSGRLVLRLDARYGSVFWADRQRWTLEQKLSAMFKLITDRASAQAEQRQRKQEERRQRRRAWEEAIPKAKHAYIEQLNRDRLRRQTASSAEAEAIRAYCVRLEYVARECGDQVRAEQIGAWVVWARQEADQMDPIYHPERLTYVVPEDVKESEFEKFMPHGLSAWHPPD